jgi:uncharacterized protein
LVCMRAFCPGILPRTVAFVCRPTSLKNSFSTRTSARGLRWIKNCNLFGFLLERGMALKNKIFAQRDHILRIGKKYGAISFRLFGSVARGEAHRGSDYDFLVELEPGRSLLDLGGLQVELEDLLGRSVDVVTLRGLRKRLKSSVIKESLPL